MKRVVVTGIGAVSPLGNSFHESWSAAKSGISGIRDITRFNVSDLRWKIAGEIQRFNVSKYLSPKEIKRLDPFVHYAVAAALMASEDAGLAQKTGIRSQKSELKNDYLTSGGVIIGSSRGGISSIEKELQKMYKLRNIRSPLKTSAYLMPSTTISMASSYVAQKLGIKGYILGISNACASGTNAIGEAYRLIRGGYQGPVLCGGTDAPVCKICLEGYGSSGALSKGRDSSASRPFDRMRDGFVLSEGACILVLEDYKQALKRGVRIYGEIIGYGNTADAYHQTMPSPDGEARAIIKALKEAGLRPEDIDFVSAHATSTPIGDKVETEAIKTVYGKKAYHIPITSFKSMTGHMLAASGSLETAFTLMCMDEGIILPVKNLKQRDQECDLNYVTREKNIEIAFSVSQSFGFGGVNAVIVFKKLKDKDNI
jgi:3-oxoacyl-[acyl-carrier-protein] synthase II